MDYHISSKREL